MTKQCSGVILELSERKTFCANFRKKFWSKFWISLYILYIFSSPSAQDREVSQLRETFSPKSPSRMTPELHIPHMKPDAQTKKNYKRGAALEWSVGKLLKVGCGWGMSGCGGVGGCAKNFLSLQQNGKKSLPSIFSPLNPCHAE